MKQWTTVAGIGHGLPYIVAFVVSDNKVYAFPLDDNNPEDHLPCVHLDGGKLHIQYVLSFPRALEQICPAITFPPDPVPGFQIPSTTFSKVAQGMTLRKRKK